MQKVVKYALINCREVNEYLDKGWQPWGNALVSWDGRSNSPHQPMVKYDEEDLAPDTKRP